MSEEKKKVQDQTDKESSSSEKTVKSTKKKIKKQDKTSQKIEELEQNIAEINDKYLRLYSEYDNYRKRTLKEKLELTKTASGDVIIDLLPVLDDFDRALKAMEGDDKGDNQSIREGVLLIFNKLKGALEKKGVEEIEAMGEIFDTEFHDAVTNIPAPSEDMKGKVVDVIEKGYLLNGKVLRYAKVVVGN